MQTCIYNFGRNIGKPLSFWSVFVQLHQTAIYKRLYPYNLNFD